MMKETFIQSVKWTNGFSSDTHSRSVLRRLIPRERASSEIFESLKASQARCLLPWSSGHGKLHLIFFNLMSNLPLLIRGSCCFIGNVSWVPHCSLLGNARRANEEMTVSFFNKFFANNLCRRHEGVSRSCVEPSLCCHSDQTVCECQRKLPLPVAS